MKNNVKPKESIVDKYIDYFDFCDPIPYKNFLINPFTVKTMRKCHFACHCLSFDPMEFEDVTLMPLKRLNLIITIFNRLDKAKKTGAIPDEKTYQHYSLILQSFDELLKNIFKGYIWNFGDWSNPSKKNVLTLVNREIINQETNEIDVNNITVNSVITLDSNEFEEVAELILYQNGFDTSWKSIPPNMRKKANEILAKLNKRNKSESPSLEKQIDIVGLYKNQSDMENLPVRKFNNYLKLIVEKLDYQIYKSGMYDAKDLKHWTSGNYDTNPYSKIIKEQDLFKERQTI